MTASSESPSACVSSCVIKWAWPAGLHNAGGQGDVTGLDAAAECSHHLPRRLPAHLRQHGQHHQVPQAPGQDLRLAQIERPVLNCYCKSVWMYVRVVEARSGVLLPQHACQCASVPFYNACQIYLDACPN